MILEEKAALVDTALRQYLDYPESPQDRIYEAMRYSLFAGGKRLRPVIMLLACEMCGGQAAQALPFACAVEMIHTYSLIHDDLPCMDNDDLRRGKPTNHKVFGEATALLAGDALLTEAFSVLINEKIPADISLKALAALATGAGIHGMILGQMLDMAGETHDLPFEILLHMHKKKTGALIRTAAVLGCYAAGILDPADSRISDISQYAEKIGLAFQIIDDRLDVLGNAETLGKATGTDQTHHKTTFMRFMDEKEAFDFAERLTHEAVRSLESYPDAQILIDLAYFLLKRNK